MGGAPAGPVAPSAHPPDGGITEGIQVSGGAGRERPASMGIPQLQGAAWQRAAAGKTKERYLQIRLKGQLSSWWMRFLW